MKIKNTIVALMIAILLIASILAVAILNIYQEERCRKLCGECLAVEVIKNGEWNLNDLCVCYGNNEIRTYRLGNITYGLD